MRTREEKLELKECTLLAQVARVGILSIVLIRIRAHGYFNPSVYTIQWKMASAAEDQRLVDHLREEPRILVSAAQAIV